MRRGHRAVDVGGRHVRVVFEVEHTAPVAATLASAGTEIFASPTRTPWNSLD
jgi:lactoylglutathione lyase